LRSEEKLHLLSLKKIVVEIFVAYDFAFIFL
jgi:hypothetical protein